MIELLVVMTALVSIVGVGIIIEQATGVWRFLKAYAHTRLRPLAPPHARDSSTGLGSKEEQ